MGDDQLSAFGHAVALGQEIDDVQRQVRHLTELLRQLRRTQKAWLTGAQGERDVIRVLVGMDDASWHVLPDRRWPGTRRANIDVLAGRRGTTAQLDRVRVVGEQDLTRDLVRRGNRLTPALVERLLDCLDRACPPMPAQAPARRVSPPDQALLSREQLWRELVETAAQEPIESWMTWLHPAQARLVGRRSSGPARIRGPAGTGKTVVALHRAKYLAARGDRVLFTSFGRTLAPINQALLTRMGPEHARRVRFATVHGTALTRLRERGLAGRHQQKAADTCFARAWARVGRSSVLSQVGVPTEYWRDEVSKVVKGRGLTDYDAYARLSRVGRSIPLQPTHRAAVWDLYECYERLRRERGVLDREDVLLTARDLVRAQPDSGFDAVIVDEVQDLTCVAVQLLHAFVGDKPDGLLIVGDGQQSIYPGGFTLSEAGVSVVGRSTVLSRNYRNREAILRYAEDVIAGDPFDDLDSTPERGKRDVVAEQPGGEVHEVTVADAAAQERALCAHVLDRGPRLGDTAVLVPTNAEVGRWLRVLTTRKIPAIALKDYDGTPSGAVKVGTFHRAKGLDFAHVCVPDRDQFPRDRRPGETTDAYLERAALERRQLYVALTRARDSLWVASRER